MTPQEKELILSVCARLAQAPHGARDAEAEKLIAEQTNALPHHRYDLVQGVICWNWRSNRPKSKMLSRKNRLRICSSN